MTAAVSTIKGNIRMPPERSEFPSEEFLPRALGCARRRGDAWRQLTEPDGAWFRHDFWRIQPASAQSVGHRWSGRTDGAARHSSSPPCPLRLASVVRHTANPLQHIAATATLPLSATHGDAHDDDFLGSLSYCLHRHHWDSAGEKKHPPTKSR